MQQTPWHSSWQGHALLSSLERSGPCCKCRILTWAPRATSSQKKYDALPGRTRSATVSAARTAAQTRGCRSIGDTDPYGMDFTVWILRCSAVAAHLRQSLVPSYVQAREPHIAAQLGQIRRCLVLPMPATSSYRQNQTKEHAHDVVPPFEDVLHADKCAAFVVTERPSVQHSPVGSTDTFVILHLHPSHKLRNVTFVAEAIPLSQLTNCL